MAAEPASARAVYLDHNATTPIAPEVLDAMLPFLREHHGNPSSTHARGRTAAKALEEARSRVARLIGAEADEIVFTSGGTEASNLAIRSIAKLAEPGRVLTSTIEHPATAMPCAWLAERGWQVDALGVDENGRLRVAEMEAALDRDVALVTVMHANNETGVIQPLEQLGRLTASTPTLLHTDAAQSVGKVPVDVRKLGVQFLSLAGHKLYAPKGVGALYVRRGTPLPPLLLGAGHERGLRPGTENVASIVGLGAAAELAEHTLLAEATRQRALAQRLLSGLEAAIPDLVCHGRSAARLPNTLSIRIPGVPGHELLARASELEASTGSACHAGGRTPSRVILAMGVAPEDALETVRLSLGRGTSNEDIEASVNALLRAAAQLRPPGRSSARRQPGG